MNIEMKPVFLHIGLHKTATKFFQHKLFPRLDADKVLYNPPELTQLCCDLMKADQEDLPTVIDHIRKQRQALVGEKQDKILISREVLAGDLFSFYKDFDQTVLKLKVAFPDAHIICFFRYQPDWILSCYRETLHEHHYQTINDFLSGDNNTPFVSNDFRDLDWNKVASLLKNNFEDKVKFLFFEDFKKTKKETIKNLLDFIGIEAPLAEPVSRDIPNRGYSAFAVCLSVLRYRFLKFLRLEKFFVHRPIRFLGAGSIPCGFESLSVLPHDKYWGDAYFRDNEEVRSDDWPDLKGRERLKYLFSWRHIVKNGLDRLVYWDWDILKGRRPEMDAYFKAQNVALAQNTGLSEKEIPDEYL